jgi:hypothetical protein
MTWWYLAGMVVGLLIMGVIDRYLVYDKAFDFYQKHKGHVVVDPVALANIRTEISRLSSSELWNEYMALTGKKKEGI